MSTPQHHISAEAEAARERARDHGKFGVQPLDRSDVSVPTVTVNAPDFGPDAETVSYGSLFDNQGEPILGEFSVGTEQCSRSVWRMDDGNYVAHTMTYGVTSRLTEVPDPHWEGFDLTPGATLTGDDDRDIRSTVDQLRDAGEQEALDNAPTLGYRVVRQSEWAICTDPDQVEDSSVFLSVDRTTDENETTLAMAQREVHLSQRETRHEDPDDVDPAEFYNQNWAQCPVGGQA